MKIIHSIGSIEVVKGGPSRSVTGLCSALSSKYNDLEVHLVAFKSDKNLELMIPNEKKVNLTLIKEKKYGILNKYKLFSNAINNIIKFDDKFCIIHDHGLWNINNISAWKAATINKVPYVINPRGMLMPGALEYKSMKKKIAWIIYQREILQRSTVLVVTSEEELLSVKKIFPNAQVALIKNGINLQNDLKDICLSNNNKNNENIMSNIYYNNNGKKKVLFMGRKHPIKNIAGLIKAWALLPKKYLETWDLLIAGPDEDNHSRELFYLIDSLELNSSIRVLDEVKDDYKATIFKLVDIFILPSFSENFGVVIAEAMSYGLPVIASYGTPWSKIDKIGCGWWVNHDPISLSNALIKGMDLSDIERISMGIIGRQYVEEEFSWSKISQETYQLYQWISGLGVRPKFLL
jgi:glycosyltransferase involved in cell wall biosynthesis